MGRKLLLAVVLFGGWAWAGEPSAPTGASVAAFNAVYTVLQSPRCLNCHPAGDVPLQRDSGEPHGMRVTRHSADVGLACSTCHRPIGIDLPHLPPANRVWRMPPASQAFQGRSPRELCLQLQGAATSDPVAFLHHVRDDSLVAWGWSPGAGRTVPPLTHTEFVAAVAAWMEGGVACP